MIVGELMMKKLFISLSIGVSLIGLLGLEAAFATLTPRGFYIINASSGKCLDVKSNSFNSGALIVQSQCNGESSQIWTVLGNNQQGSIMLYNNNSKLCIDIPSSLKTDGVKLQQYRCGSDETTYNQLFFLDSITVGSRIQRIRAHHSNKCLDVPYGSHADNEVIQQYTCHNGVNQQWLFVMEFYL